jgi:hypothetical protein
LVLSVVLVFLCVEAFFEAILWLFFLAWVLALACLALLLDVGETFVVTVVVAFAPAALVVVVLVVLALGCAAIAGVAISAAAATDAINVFICFLLSPAGMRR